MRRSYARYHARIQAWCKQYGVPEPQHSYDLTRIKLSCLKCGSQKCIQRNHKGHEYIFACVFPEHHAARYVAFHSKDTAPLCKRCHKNFHRAIRPIAAEFFATTRGGRVSHNVCEKYRKRILERFEKWIKRRVPAAA